MNNSFSVLQPSDSNESEGSSQPPFDPPIPEGANQRRYPRTVYLEPVQVIVGGWIHKQHINAFAYDISSTGLCLQIPGDQLYEVGSKVTLLLKMIPSEIHSITLEKPQLVEGVVTRALINDDSSWIYGVRLSNVIADGSEKVIPPYKRITAMIMLSLLIAAICVLKINDLKWFWYAPFHRMYGLLAGAFFLSRVLLSIVYREPKDNGFLPRVSVIISVKNEEAHIVETVKRVFDVRYPPNKMELIVIDDGSTDNTWGALQKIKDLYQNFKLYRFPKNQGKRHGMALGAREASGDILVYVDSDSYIEAEGIYRLVQPFHDEKVGAVAGHTRVIVEENNSISKMEAVRYYVSHQLFKTAESVFGTVTCCPGAFSAYRREAVLKVLPVWLNQTFMGTKATFGDDRSLTNHILRTYRVVYHASANCVTYVPDTWKKFFTQQLRWKKSWARETTIAARIMIHKHPLAALFYYIGVLVTLLSPFVFLTAMLYNPIVLGQSFLPYLLGVLMVYLFLCIVYLHNTGASHWYYGLLFAVCYMGILCWQTFYAIGTMNKNHWGTR